MRIDRRSFLRGVVGASGAALLGGMAGHTGGLTRAFGQANNLPPLPPPGESGIEHIVVVMMENRSFDHLLGWLPNADGQQAGLTYRDRSGAEHATHPLAPDFTGCGHADPDHSYEGGREQYNGGAMDGFLRSGSNDEFAIGYYLEPDRPFFNSLARNFTTCDQFFCSILGPTFPNRIFSHGAQTDRLQNTFALASMRTIWDRLAAARVSRKYYYASLPFLGLWGLRYLTISHRYPEFFEDISRGRLPAVSFVDPHFTIDDNVPGDANDDHPHADIRRGDAFLAETFRAVAESPAWDSTVFIVTYDEWGGFFDHVAPPRAVAPNLVDPDLEDGRALLGFRVPVIVASPFSRGVPTDPTVSSLVFDHTSVLKLIEWRWGLAPLTARDASSDIENLAYALDLTNPDPELPNLPRPAAPRPTSCRAGSEVAGQPTVWAGLRDSGLLDGWDLPR